MYLQTNKQNVITIIITLKQIKVVYKDQNGNGIQTF